MANTAQAGLSPRLYGGAPNWTENPIGYGSPLADKQLIDWQEQLTKFPRLYSGGGYGMAPQTGGTGNTGSWASGFPPAPGSGTGNGTGASGFPLLQTPKSPHGNAILDALLGRIAGLPNDPNQPLHTSVKDPAQEGRIATAGAQFDTTTGQSNQRLADFTKQFYEADPQAKAQTDQEIASVGQYYAPASDPTSVTATLNRLAAQRHQAVQGSIQRALAHAQRTTNLARLGMGGADSYINQQFMDTAAGIGADEARQQADLARTNFMTVRSGQNSMLGQRSALLHSYLMRGLAPITAGQQLMSGQLANLGTLGSITNANRLYQTPEQLLAARFGLLGQYSGNLNALNIFGVGGNFSSPALNWGAPPTAGGGNPMLPGGGVTLDARTGMPSGPAGGGVPAEVMRLNPSDQRAAAHYHMQTGKWPTQDANFSPEMWQWALSQTPGLSEGPMSYGMPGGGVDYNSGENSLSLPDNPFQWITPRASAGDPTNPFMAGGNRGIPFTGNGYTGIDFSGGDY